MESKFIALMVVALMGVLGFATYQTEETKRECIRTPGCSLEAKK